MKGGGGGGGGGEEIGIPGETPLRRVSENAIYTKAGKFKPQPRLEPRTLALVAGYESRRANHDSTCQLSNYV